MTSPPGPAREWLCLGVPIDCLAQPGGTELAPDALREAGLNHHGRFVDLGDTSTRLRGPVRDPRTGVVAGDDVIALTGELRERVAQHADPDSPLLVLGGCCTLLPGVLGGVRANGDDVALVYCDGHIDLYDGRTSPTGEAADMPLAVILGFGPQEWVDAAGPGARLRPAELTLLGPRDEEEARSNGSVVPADFGGLHYVDANGLRHNDPRRLGAETAHRVATQGGFWVHVDVDVLDENVFPATDYLAPGGLDWPTLTQMLRPLTTAPECRGLSIACYNPEKDPDGTYARRLVQFVDDIIA